jgi:NADH-quinone oxidoreductase subunit F
VDEVTIYYRRSRQEMPAFQPEIDAALEEGVKLELLLSPSRIQSRDGRVSGVTFTRNRLGTLDTSGRRSFEAIPGSEITVSVDTLIVAIGEQVLSFNPAGSEGIEVTRQGTLTADRDSLATARPGVFAGGDVVTGPNTVVDAIAAGKRVALMIERFLRDEELVQPATPAVPRMHVPPSSLSPEELEAIRRVELPTIAMEERRAGFAEVELCLSETDATREARRCLRCDLEFTRPKAAVARKPVASKVQIGPTA